MGRYRLGPVYWGSDAGAYVPLAREQDKKANPELHFQRPKKVSNGSFLIYTKLAF